MVDLNPNCSEAIMRISPKQLNKKELLLLLEYLQNLDNIATSEPNKYEWWYDSYIYYENFDDMTWIDIKGETPFNHWDELENYINKLPFSGKLVIGYRD